MLSIVLHQSVPNVDHLQPGANSEAEVLRELLLKIEISKVLPILHLPPHLLSNALHRRPLVDDLHIEVPHEHDIGFADVPFLIEQSGKEQVFVDDSQIGPVLPLQTLVPHIHSLLFAYNPLVFEHTGPAAQRFCEA